MKVFQKAIVINGEDEKIGVLMDTDRGTVFRYDPEWRGSPISSSLPLDGRFSDDEARNFFLNLLPEKPRDRAFLEFSRLSYQRLAQFLLKYGSDLPGSISIAGTNTKSRDITREIEANVGENLSLDDIGLRLSLAGGEPKVAVIPKAIDGELHFFSPCQANPSTHILKSNFRLTFMEAYGMGLANACGIDVAPCELLSINGNEAILIERFDRKLENGKWRKLKQEDFCQQLGLPPEMKYSIGNSGADTRDMAKLMLARLPQEDIRKFLAMTIFSIMIGNLDDHAKNYAIVEDGEPRLAPAYDIVCVSTIKALARSRDYPEEILAPLRRYRNIGVELPRIFGGERLAYRIQPRDFNKMGVFFNMDGDEIAQIWNETANSLDGVLHPFTGKFVDDASKKGFKTLSRMRAEAYADAAYRHIGKRIRHFIQIGEKFNACHSQFPSFTNN